MTRNDNFIALSIATVLMYFSTAAGAPAFSLGGISAGIGSGGFYFGAGGGGGAAGGIANALCSIAGWFQGGIGQAIASLAIIFLGISAFFGKVTWGTALMFAVGIFAIFGSADIVQAIVGGVGGGSGLGISIGSGGWGISYGSGGSCAGF